MYGSPIVTCGLLAGGILIGLIGRIGGPPVTKVLLALFLLSALGAIAFLWGQSNARSRHDRKDGRF